MFIKSMMTPLKLSLVLIAHSPIREISVVCVRDDVSSQASLPCALCIARNESS